MSFNIRLPGISRQRPHLHPPLHLHWARPRRNLPHNLRRHPARAQQRPRLRLRLHWVRPRRHLPYNLRRHPARAQKV
ncbi:unnamed protein product, partial [Ectocarpus fasciculatus]